MSKFLRAIDEVGFAVIVSLPRNDAELAAAAVSAGADALKVHINLDHDASGTRFGSLDEERERLEAVLAAAEGVPVGIVPGAQRVCAKADARRLVEMGMDFMDISLAHLPDWWHESWIPARMVAVGEPSEMWDAVATAPDFIEAAITPKAAYGYPWGPGDTAKLRGIAREAPVPIIVPTQRKIQPSQLGELARAGARGIIIGAIVTGGDAEGIAQATAAFVQAAREGL